MLFIYRSEVFLIYKNIVIRKISFIPPFQFCRYFGDLFCIIILVLSCIVDFRDFKVGRCLICACVWQPSCIVGRRIYVQHSRNIVTIVVQCILLGGRIVWSDIISSHFWVTCSPFCFSAIYWWCYASRYGTIEGGCRFVVLYRQFVGRSIIEANSDEVRGTYAHGYDALEVCIIAFAFTGCCFYLIL